MTVIKPFPFHPETNPQPITPVGSGWGSTLLAGGAVLILLLAELSIPPAALSPRSQGTKPTTRRASMQLNTTVGSILFITSRARSTRYKMKKKLFLTFFLAISFFFCTLCMYSPSCYTQAITLDFRELLISYIYRT